MYKKEETCVILFLINIIIIIKEKMVLIGYRDHEAKHRNHAKMWLISFADIKSRSRCFQISWFIKVADIDRVKCFQISITCY